MRYAVLTSAYAVLTSAYAVLALAGCTATYNKTSQVGTTPALLTSADLRVITERAAPFAPGDTSQHAVCTEPPPDVAKALQTALTLSAKADTAAGAGGQGSLESQTAEQLAELSGRIPSVVALRDGTYRLCEAWANGAIGDSAYALALGRYGELLVTGIAADDAVSAARAAPARLTASLSPNQTDTQNGSTTKQGTTTPAQNAPASQTAGQTDPIPGTDGIRLASLTLQPLLAAASEPTASPAATGQAAHSPSSSSSTTANRSTSNATGTSAQPSGSTSATTDTSASVAAVANALEEIQENYLTLGAAGPLIVACIAASDHTTPHWQQSDLLTPTFCRTMISEYIEGVAAAVKAKAQAKSSASITPAPSTVATARH